MNPSKISRRLVLKGMLVSLSIAALGQIMSFSQGAFAAAKKLIDMSGKSSDPTNKAALNVAKGLNYVEDAKAADKAGKIKRVEKSGVAPSNQICRTCQFYKVVEENKSGECMLIPNVLVHHGGYCNSWVKMASLKPEEIKKFQ